MEQKFYYRVEAEAGTAYDPEERTDEASYCETTISLSEGESYEEVHDSDWAKQKAVMGYELMGMTVDIKHVTPISQEEYDREIE